MKNHLQVNAELQLVCGSAATQVYFHALHSSMPSSKMNAEKGYSNAAMY